MPTCPKLWHLSQKMKFELSSDGRCSLIMTLWSLPWILSWFITLSSGNSGVVEVAMPELAVAGILSFFEDKLHSTTYSPLISATLVTLQAGTSFFRCGYKWLHEISAGRDAQDQDAMRSILSIFFCDVRVSSCGPCAIGFGSPCCAQSNLK